MPAFSTPIADVVFCAWRRRARPSGQRPLLVALRPSVIESPSVTTAAAELGAITSTPLRKYQCSVLVASGRSGADERSPALKKDGARAPGCVVNSDGAPFR